MLLYSTNKPEGFDNHDVMFGTPVTRITVRHVLDAH